MRSGPQTLVLVVLAAVAGTAVLFRERLLSRRGDASETSSPSTVAAPGERSVLAPPSPSSVSEAEPGPRVEPVPSASVALDAPKAPDAGGACPDGMILVEGSYCPAVAHFCADWVGDDPTAAGPLRPPKRCRRFKERFVCEGDIAKLHFCIDRLEYPNLHGVLPATRASYRDAQRACAVEGKRLCEVEEWTLACEGPRTLPFPAGRERDPKNCNIDRPLQFVNLDALARPADVSMEVERVDGRRAGGANPGCGSHDGVLDLVGNVAEWVHDRHGMRGAPHSDMILVGGGWEAAPSTCRDREERDDPDHRGLMTGFRCCADARDAATPRRGGAAGRGRR